MKFKVWYSGTGSARDQDPEVLNFKNRDIAINYAWEMAKDDLASYGGMHGYPDPDEDDFDEEAESWIDYDVEPVAENKLKKAAKEIKKKI